MEAMGKEAFYLALAEYLVGQAPKMSIRLAIDPGDPEVLVWRAMYRATPLMRLFGYPTVAEAATQPQSWLEAR